MAKTQPQQPPTQLPPQGSDNGRLWDPPCDQLLNFTPQVWQGGPSDAETAALNSPEAYLDAVEGAFGADVDYAQLVKLYGDAPDAAKGRYSPADCTGIRKTRVEGKPDPAHISTSYVERQNLTMWMSMRRFTRLTNAFSKKTENHAHMVALYTTWYNFVRIHKTLRVAPAMAAGLSDRLWSMEDVVALMDAHVAAPAKRGAYKPRKSKGANLAV